MPNREAEECEALKSSDRRGATYLNSKRVMRLATQHRRFDQTAARPKAALHVQTGRRLVRSASLCSS